MNTVCSHTVISKKTKMSSVANNLCIPAKMIISDQHSESDVDMSSEFTSEGGESTGDIEELSPEVMENLITSLEYHFSDEALARDLFLLKHIKRQPEGYVSLKLLAGYKKVKKISRNWKVVRLAAKESKSLEVNETGTRVRRKTPLTESLAADLPSSRTLVAVGIPTEECNVETIAGKFSSYGSIAALQIVKPGKVNPPQLFSMVGNLSETSEFGCAVIEFEDVWGASKALDDTHKHPMTLYVMRNKRRRERGSTDIRSSSRPYHPQLHRLIDGVRIGSESSGSDGDDMWLSLGLAGNRTQPQQYLGVKHFSSSVPTSPALCRHPPTRRSPAPRPLEIRSPRGPDGSKGFVKSPVMSPR